MKSGQSALRTKAESKLAYVPRPDAAGRPAEELVHDLQVHEIELEMQNDELRHAQLALEESRDRYLDLYEFAPVGYFTLTDKALITEVNFAGAKLLGKERKRILQRRFAQYVVPADSDRYHQLIVSVLHHGERESCDLSLQRGDGSVIQAQLDCVRVAASDKPPMVRLTLTDITERKRAEAELRVAAAAFDSQEGMLVTDADTTILRVNHAFTEITGFTPAETVGQTAGMLKSGRYDAAFYAGMWKQIARTGEWRGEIWNLHKSGAAYPAWLTITVVKDVGGAVTHYVGTLIDITQRKSAEAAIERLAFYDPVTLLPNRRLLLDRLQHALAALARIQRLGAVLFIDLDDFKDLNDTLGHDIGDMLLQQVARRLMTCVRATDTVARLGGDEFVVVLVDLSDDPKEAASQAEIVGEKILSALNLPSSFVDHEHHCTACIGVTLFTDHTEVVEDLLKRADLAMYRAKTLGRNSLQFFDPEMQASVSARVAMESDLRAGVQEGQFVLHYQPQVDRDGRLTGAEALARWRHPRLGLIAPAEFIPLAEKTGLIQSLGLYVLETVCAQLMAWSARPDMAHLTLSMNVSAREFRRPDFVTRVLDVIHAAGADPRKLVLEFTESLLMDSLEETVVKMRALKVHGVGFALDDFGTGFSSLSYLKHLPLDQLKIDRSFVRDILLDSNDAAIARTIISLGQSLGLAVVAEGVETAEQRNLLAAHGCEAFQGFHFGRPGEVDELRLMAESTN